MKLRLNHQANQMPKLDFNTTQTKEVNRGWNVKLESLLQKVLAYFMEPSEPIVWTVQDATGLIHWKAYDPSTNRSIDYTSEHEMRVWIEQRHYQ
jgi:hypothetical protein